MTLAATRRIALLTGAAALLARPAAAGPLTMGALRQRGTLRVGCEAAETVRGAVGSVERGQEEAARAIGMTRPQILAYVLLPQALRPIVPPLTNELISLVKNTSLLSVISVYELTRAGQAIISTHFVPFEIYLLLALYYYVTVKIISYASPLVERRMPVL